MKIISTIEDQEVIKSILNHLGLWIVGARSCTMDTTHITPIRCGRSVWYSLSISYHQF